MQFDSALPGKRENCCGCQVVVCLCQSCGAHFAGPNVHRLRELATGWWLDGRMPGAASQPSGSKLPRHGMVAGRGIGLWLVLWNHCHSGPFQRLHSSWRGSLLPLGCAAVAKPAGAVWLEECRGLLCSPAGASSLATGFWLDGRMQGAASLPSGSKLFRHMGSAG